MRELFLISWLGKKTKIATVIFIVLAFVVAGMAVVGGGCIYFWRKQKHKYTAEIEGTQTI